MGLLQQRQRVRRLQGRVELPVDEHRRRAAAREAREGRHHAETLLADARAAHGEPLLAREQQAVPPLDRRAVRAQRGTHRLEQPALVRIRVRVRVRVRVSGEWSELGLAPLGLGLGFASW